MPALQILVTPQSGYVSVFVFFQVHIEVFVELIWSVFQKQRRKVSCIGMEKARGCCLLRSEDRYAMVYFTVQSTLLVLESYVAKQSKKRDRDMETCTQCLVI